MLTLQNRVDAYATALARFPDSVPVVSPTGRWLNGMWLLGNAYKGSGYYGSYPPSYLERIAALFPDAPSTTWLHLFSGSLSPLVPGLRIDLRAPGEGVAPANVRGDATALPFLDRRIKFVCADPPYSTADAKRYKTGGVNKLKVFCELARVVESGGHLVWLDTMLPIFRKREWHHWGMIGIQVSTNHRTRLCSLFTRTDADAQPYPTPKSERLVYAGRGRVRRPTNEVGQSVQGR